MDYTLKKPARSDPIDIPRPTAYTDEKMKEALSEGYINIVPALWDHIPPRSHVRYTKKGDGILSRAERFRPGGFVKNHFRNGEKKMFTIENKPGGAAGEAGYVTFPLAYDDVDELWKKYPRESFIEVHLIYTSLAQKNKQIKDLTERVKRLEAALSRNKII